MTGLGKKSAAIGARTRTRGRPGGIPGDYDRTNPLEAEVCGEGQAVVLLHGQPGSAADWRLVVEALQDEYLVVVPDRPGYGRTGGPAAGYAANAVALAALLDRLGVERAITVGHSWGGGAAIAAAQLFPDRVAGLLLVASVGPGERFGWSDRVLAAPVAGEVIAALTIGTTGLLLGSDRVQNVAKKLLTGRARQIVTALSLVSGARTGARVWQSFVVEQRALLNELDDLAPRLKSIAVPTTILNGDADRVVPPTVATGLAAAIPGATHIVIAGAHHLLPLHHPQIISSAVRGVARRARSGEPVEPQD